MNRLKRIVAALLVGTLAVGLMAGCMAGSVAPVTPQQVVSNRTAQQDGLLGGVLGIVDALVKLVFRVLNIVGSVGGSLSNGRWRVDVPAGAFDGTASVGVGVASSTSASCELQITPADKNQFKTPVRLTVDCSSVSPTLLKTYVISWFNPTTRTWVPVQGSTVDLTNKTVSAPLQHFSTYSVGPAGGKAGW